MPNDQGPHDCQWSRCPEMRYYVYDVDSGTGFHSNSRKEAKAIYDEFIAMGQKATQFEDYGA